MRIPFVADLVREDLGDALVTPAKGTGDEIVFTVESGDTPATIAPRLLEAGMIDSERAFLFEARTTDLASKLAAGRFASRATSRRRRSRPASSTIGSW